MEQEQADWLSSYDSIKLIFSTPKQSYHKGQEWFCVIIKRIFTTPLLSKPSVLQATLSVAEPNHISQGKNLIRPHLPGEYYVVFPFQVLDLGVAAQTWNLSCLVWFLLHVYVFSKLHIASNPWMHNPTSTNRLFYSDRDNQHEIIPFNLQKKFPVSGFQTISDPSLATKPNIDTLLAAWILNIHYSWWRFVCVCRND